MKTRNFYLASGKSLATQIITLGLNKKFISKFFVLLLPQQKLKPGKKLKNLIPGLTILIFGISLSANNAKAMNTPDISEIVVCNTYWDNLTQIRREEPKTVLKQPKTGKFLVIFSGNIPDIQSIQAVTANGPNGYKMEFALKPYSRVYLNGYSILTRSFLMFHAYDTQNFLKNGEYVLKVFYKNGSVFSKKKILQFNQNLLNEYRIIKKQFTPVGKIAPLTGQNLSLKWSMPKKGKYYAVTRLKYAQPNEPFFENILYWNNIFLELGASGLMKNSLEIPGEFIKPGKKYVWFTEILDHNHLPEVNTAIFCPFQFFEIKN